MKEIGIATSGEREICISIYEKGFHDPSSPYQEIFFTKESAQIVALAIKKACALVAEPTERKPDEKSDPHHTDFGVMIREDGNDV